MLVGLDYLRTLGLGYIIGFGSVFSIVLNINISNWDRFAREGRAVFLTEYLERF